MPDVKASVPQDVFWNQIPNVSDDVSWSTPIGAGVDNLLMEDGFALLLENGSGILME